MGFVKFNPIPLSSKFKFVKLELDTSELDEQMQHADGTVKEIAKSRVVLQRMAAFVIRTAHEESIIPQNYRYRIRTPKKRIPRRDSDGNIVRFKSGKKKGQPKYDKATPALYYRYVSKYYENVPIYDENSYSRKERFDRHVVRSRETRVHAVKAPSGRYIPITKAKVTYDKSRTVSRPVTRGTGLKVVGYKTGWERKRVHWTETPFAYARYNQEYTRDEEHGGFVADRIPHLDDVNLTHHLNFTNNTVQISISNKKPKDKRFYEEGGVQYAGIQYNGADKTWNRAFDTTTSHWLEVAIGLPVPSDVKGYEVYSLATAQKNYNNMLEIMAEAIRKGIRKK